MSHLREATGLLRRPRVLVGVGCMLVATVLGAITVHRASARTMVWQLDHAVAAGTVLGVDDVHAAAVAIDGGVRAYVGTGTSPVGLVAGRDLDAGELLSVAAVRPAADEVRHVTVPVEARHHPVDLRKGQRVDVWWSTRADAQEPVRSERVARAVPVADVVVSDVGGGPGVVLQVPEAAAAELIGALRSGDIDLVAVEVA